MNLRTLALLFVASLTLTFSIGLHSADFQQIRIKGPKSSDSDYSGQTYGPITAADTLWRIASDARQNTNHSIYQVMLATYELNPDAFERNNINLMRDGAILRLPASKCVKRVNEAQGDANKFNALLNEYVKAQVVTKRRLYLETMAQVLPKVTHKILLDDKASSILPLLQLNNVKGVSKWVPIVLAR